MVGSVNANNAFIKQKPVVHTSYVVQRFFTSCLSNGSGGSGRFYRLTYHTYESPRIDLVALGPEYSKAGTADGRYMT